MRVSFSGYNGLSILEIDSETKIVDNDLQVYETFCVDDPFLDPLDIIRAFVKHTLEYYKDFPYKQFMVLELKAFAQSEFVKQTVEYVNSQE